MGATGVGAMVRRMLPLVVAVMLVGLVAAPARAIGSFGPPVTISDPPCDFDAWNVDLAQDSAGVAHGFADLWGSACNTSFRIDYFQGSGTSWTREATPYHGFVVAAAWDTTGTYLLYVDAAGLGLRITKRLANGTYTAGRLLSTFVGPDGSLGQGDVVAAGGQWWAVWREHVAAGGGPGDEFDQTELFQAYSIGGPLHSRQRITNNPMWDSAPSLARMPTGTFPLTLVWARGGSDFGANPADLRRALGSAAGTWSSSSLAAAGELNFWPDVKVVGTTTYRRATRPASASRAATCSSAGRSRRRAPAPTSPSGSAGAGPGPTPPPPQRRRSSPCRGSPPGPGRRPP